jgi:DGQHR domain-containing protein
MNTTTTMLVPGFLLQREPPIYVAAIRGTWLLKHTTPSWRLADPDKGFQRMVRQERARAIALSVLDQKRTFPNAIVLASEQGGFEMADGNLLVPSNTRLLVVDGQHRLWAQKYSSYDALYSCIIHMQLTEIDMARLFLEINDNQKRVPASLRWDLVRLVRPKDDPGTIAAAELVYLLATDEESPLFQRIDLTGEQSAIELKQSSVAPELKPLLAKRSPLGSLSFDEQYQVIVQFLVALREVDRDGWRSPKPPFLRARVLRALFRLVPEMVSAIRGGADPGRLTYRDFLPYLKRIDEASLDSDVIRAAQGSAGMIAIYNQIHGQVFGQD